MTPDLSYAQVTASAEQLISEGQTPCVQCIQARLQSANSDLIEAHLKAWQHNHPQARFSATSAARGHPPHALDTVLQRMDVDVPQPLPEPALDTQAHIALLSAMRDALSRQVEELTLTVAKANEHISDLATRHNALTGRVEQLLLNAAANEVALAQEQRATENARIELAVSRQREAMHQQQDKHQQAALAQVTIALSDAQNARERAERVSAISEMKLDTVAANAIRQRTDAIRLTAQLKTSQAELHEAQREISQQRGELEALRQPQSPSKSPADAATGPILSPRNGSQPH